MEASLQPQRIAGSARLGFTLVELFVVMTIIGILIALLLPSAQVAGEVGPAGAVREDVKQLAAGMLDYESANGRFPSGGWGWLWVGDPDCGFNPQSQPGSWVYQNRPSSSKPTCLPWDRDKPGPPRPRH